MEGMTGRTLAVQGAVHLLAAFFLGLYIALFVWGRFDGWTEGLQWISLSGLLGTGILSTAAALGSRLTRSRWFALLWSSAVQVVLGVVLLYYFLVPPSTLLTSMPVPGAVPSIVNSLWPLLVGLPGFVLLVMGVSGLVVLRLDPSGGRLMLMGRAPAR